MEDSLINQLPDDCLKHIFSFLPVSDRLEAERVCKRWHIISEKGWNDVKELEILDSHTNNIIYPILKRCGRFLRKLTINLVPQNMKCLSMVEEFCRLDQLEDFGIVFDRIVAKQLQIETYKLKEIFGSAKKLVALTFLGFIRYMIVYLNYLNPKILEKLILLRVDGATSLIDPDRFPNLKELTLGGFEIFEDTMERHRDSLKRLEKLDIQNCRVPLNFLERIGTFTNLQELSLVYNICDIRNEDIRSIVNHCCSLKRIVLTFSGLSRVTSECFKYLGNMPSLEFLNLQCLSNVNNYDIVSLTNVKQLTFYNCENIIGDGLIDLIKESSNLKELTFYKIKDLNRSFLDDVGQIFQNGQRQKPLCINVEFGCNTEQLHWTPEDADHPLLRWVISPY